MIKMYRNLKTRSKLILGFGILLILAMIIGAFGIIGMKSIEANGAAMYNDRTVPISNLSTVSSSLSCVSTTMGNLAGLSRMDGQAALNYVEGEKANLVNYLADLATAMEDYKNSIPATAEAALQDYAVIEKIYSQQYLPAYADLKDAILANNEAKVVSSLIAFDAAGAAATESIASAIETNISKANGLMGDSEIAANGLVRLQIILLILAVFISIATALLISKLISSPMSRIVEVAEQAGLTGDLHFDSELVAMVRDDATYKDETGAASLAFASMVDHLIEQAKALEVVAAGDLTVNVPVLGEKDTLGTAIESMVRNLNNMMNSVNVVTDQVSAGSTQIADGAQALSQGSTEQASSVEELSAAMTEVMTQTNANTDNTAKALTAVNRASELMQETVAYMGEMETAMGGISSSSEEIAKIIQVIDDIAFQTNILALNAAVEAARAGQHGKGFAVVADEVRNLASKSAEAASETSALIQKSLDHVGNGTGIVKKTSDSIQGVATNAQQVQEIITMINAASMQQQTAITQINAGIEQVSQVVQTNSATAEESAASSEELSAQAQTLKDLVSRFKLKTESKGGFDNPFGGRPSYGSSSMGQSAAGGSDRYAFSGDDGYMGF